MIELTLPEPPSINSYWISKIHPSKKHAMVFKSAEAKHYVEEVRLACVIARVRPFTDDVVMWMKWHRSSTGRGDLDNRFKCLADALKGFAYNDDRQIAKIVMQRVTVPGRAYVEVKIDRMPGQVDSLFDEAEALVGGAA